MFLHSYQTMYNYPVYSTSAINLRVIKCPCTFTHFQITSRIRARRRAPATSTYIWRLKEVVENEKDRARL
jgi:hypothetical protein